MANVTWADDKMLGLDLEATDADPYKALPVAFALGKFDFGQVQGKVRTGLINPGVRIPEEATKIHGITTTMVQQRGGDLFKSGEGLAVELMRAAQQGVILTGMNLRYDLTLIDTVCKLSGDGLRDRGWLGYVLDVLVLDHWMEKYRKGSRNLGALCEHYGVEHGGAHDAGHDVVAAFRVLQAMCKRHPELLEFNLDQLMAAQCHAHYEWITHLAEYRAEKGGEPVNLEREIGWPLPGEIPTMPAVEWPGNSPDAGNELVISNGQKTSLILRFKELGIEARNDRLWLLTEVLGRQVATSSELNEAEYHKVKGYLASAEQAGGGPVLATRAREAVAAGWVPPAVPKPAQGTTAAPAADLDLGTLDLSAYPKGVVASAMRTVMQLNGGDCDVLLGTYGLKKTGKVNDKRLRLLEYACQEITAGNPVVEAAFG